MFCLLLYCSSDRLRIRNDCIYDLGSIFVEWAYTDSQSVTAFVLPDDEVGIVSKQPLCNTVNTYVSANGQMRPVHVFRHGLQDVYNRIKGGVDAAAQFSSRVNTPGLNVGWEERIVLYFMKTLLVNGFIAWHIEKCEQYLR